MLTFKRALIAAAFLLTTLFLLTRSNGQSIQTSMAGSTSAVEPVELRPESSASPIAAKKLGTQHALIDTSKFTLQEKLAYQFPYDVEGKFPGYIWQTWKTTPSSGDFDQFREAEASWSEKHPGFIHEVITDQVAVHLMTHLYVSVPEVLEAYHALPLPVLKADFFRYLILLARGGIYSDIDTHALQSALEWIPQSVKPKSVGLVIGIEADPDRLDWQEWYSRRIQFCQWTIQSKPGHPVLREIVASITKETLKKKSEGTLKTFQQDKVIEFTGPAVWTDIIMQFFNDGRYFDLEHSQRNISWRDFTGMTAPKKVGDVVVLPITSFSPGVQQMGAKDYDDPMAYVKHEFEGTWKPENLRHIGEIYEDGKIVTPETKAATGAAAKAAEAAGLPAPKHA